MLLQSIAPIMAEADSVSILTHNAGGESGIRVISMRDLLHGVAPCYTALRLIDVERVGNKTIIFTEDIRNVYD